LSSFVGREAELAQLVEQHARTRLLTLVGPGGVGKTRLALRLAARVRGYYGDGVWLVDLGHTTGSADVPRTVADAFGMREQAGRSWDEVIAERLRTQDLLLILDNCEYVLARCRDLVEALLPACPGLRILTTSRQPLGASGERVWRARPLEASDAIQLFAERAATGEREFKLTTQHLGRITQICRRLDGLPLALELVAARVETMELVDIADRLETGLARRVGGHRGAPLRPQTLRATLDWSVTLLDDTERLLLRRLAVFASGWTLAGAQAVCTEAALSPTRMAKLLQRLASRSLVTVEYDGDSARYRLQTTLREYLLEQLDASDEAVIVYQLHAGYVLEIAQLADPESLNVAHATVLERESAEVDAALLWALNQHDAELGLRLAIGARSFWYFRGRYSVARCWLGRLLELAQAAETHIRADALRTLAVFLKVLGEYASAERYLHEALEQYEARGDRLGIALSMRQLGGVTMWRGDLRRAQPLLVQAARRLYELRSPDECGALFNAGAVALELGEPERALALADECEDRGRRWSQSNGQAGAIVLRALVAAQTGASVQGEQLLRAGLEMQEGLGYQQLSVLLYSELGHVLFDQGRPCEAKDAFAEAIQRAVESGEQLQFIRALEGVARCAASGQPAEAIHLATAAAHFRATLRTTPWPRDVRRIALWLPQAKRELGEKAYAAARSIGQSMTHDDVRALANALIARPERDAGPPSPLTPRETQVAILVGRGLSTRQIAEDMVISVATVRVHVDHILAKLDLHSRTRIALWATQHGLLTRVPQSRGARLPGRTRAPPPYS
jgi:predicted ATPase/DNA-binding CsgD family transcriptional regulator